MRAFAATVVACALAAILLQPRVLPLGLFNDGARAYALASTAAGVAAAAALLVFAFEAVRRRPNRLGGALRGALVAFLLLEAMLWLLDGTLVSRGAARLGGPYREMRDPDGRAVMLKKPRPGSPLGFRVFADPEAGAQGAPDVEPLRLLFLGDSYVEGSGRAAACNYPEVAAAAVAEATGHPTLAINAGVAGAGPVDALRMLRFLADRGVGFDAVVHTLFLENDFTDNLPATDRRVVAGMTFRFPESVFLRTFHPLNTRTARWSLFVARAGTLLRRPAAAARRDTGRCDLEARPLGTVAPELEQLVRRRWSTNYGPAPRSAFSVVGAALSELRAEAEALGVPYVQVVFPDRALVDADLRSRLGLSLEQGDPERLMRFVREQAGAGPVDASPALEEGSAMYRSEDTHLSDLGNVRAGRHVGARIADRLPAPGGSSDAAGG